MLHLLHQPAQIAYPMVRTKRHFSIPGGHWRVLLLILAVILCTAAMGHPAQGALPGRVPLGQITGIPYTSSLFNLNYKAIQPAKVSPRPKNLISAAIEQHMYRVSDTEIHTPSLTFLPAHWWQRDWVVLVLILVVVMMIAGLRRLELSRIRLRDQIRQADFEAAKLKELNQLKSQFFTNISHEFRTPLTLIKGPVEQLMSNTTDPSVLASLRGVHNNAGRLLNLINQLLDLARLESGQYSLKVTPGDISSFIKGQVYSFQSLTAQKGITLIYQEDTSQLSQLPHEMIVFDREVLQHMITNLLSNAVKFTGENGRIEVQLTLKNDNERGILIGITVEDTGIGIAEVHLPYIFDRFYQVESSALHPGEGSGIGLAFVKELVDLHKGTISVKSKRGAGTQFRITLPGSIHCYSDEEIDLQPNGNISTNVSQVNTGLVQEAESSDPDILPAENHQNPLVLVVEDHYEVRQFIIQSLGEAFQVMEAPTARRGLEMALQYIPDVIVSDVMMPGMDGLTFCSKIKSNEKTSHVPLIFLTARATDEDLMCGLENGADAYLTKPFSPRELEVRVRNLVESRRIMREKFDRQIVVSPGEIVVSSRDRLFMEKILRIVEEHISREDFVVEELAANAGMSQSQLQRKLKALINQSPNQLIRSVRLQRARELITKNAGTISEISYMVGYGDPGYFTKSYKSYFGVLPSEDRSN